MAIIPTLGGFETLILLQILGYLLYKWSTRNFDYWEKRGVPYVKPIPFFGNFLEVFTFRTTIGHLFGKYYNEYKTRFFGVFILNTPHLVVNDPDLIKAILVKDFNHFYDRTIVSEEKYDSLTSKFLFFLKNPEWKYMRTKMTSVFTTGKIKAMLPLINKAAVKMTVYVDKLVEKKSIEAKEVCAKYSTDVIASCAFGIRAGSFDDENASFRVIGRKMFDFTLGNALRQISYFIAPSIVKLFKLPFLDPITTTFMRDVFWKTIKEREKANFKRNDLIDVIIQMQKQSSPKDLFQFKGDRVVAQAGLFYAAGFETVSSTLAFALYELSIYPEIQTKLRLEIQNALQEHEKFSYEVIQNMKYLHMIICETLRKYPVLPFLERMCMEDYNIPDSDLVIEKGTPVYISMFGLHYDPQYFPNPEKFDPERFSEENKSSIPSCIYIPFGEGPRVCIGERFGLIVTKLGLAHLLYKYEIERSADTPVPIKYQTKSLLLASTVGIPVKFTKLISEAA